MGDGLYTSHPAFTNWSKGHYGGRSLLSEYWYKYRRIDPDLRNIVMCIEVVFSVDKRVFISSRPCNVSSSSTGAEYNYLPVMKSEPELKSSVSIGGSDSSARSFSFELPNELVDASALLKSGRMLAGVAEVSLQYDGGDYDNRLVVMRGEMDSGVSFFPANGGTMQFSITDPGPDPTSVHDHKAAIPFRANRVCWAALSHYSERLRYGALFLDQRNGNNAAPSYWIWSD